MFKLTFAPYTLLFFFWSIMKMGKQQKLASDFHVGHLILEAVAKQSQKQSLN